MASRQSSGEPGKRIPPGGAPRRPASTGGFTLVETMVVVLITGVLSVSLVQMLQVAQTSADHNRIYSELQQNARVAIQQVSDDLRHVSYGKDPTQPSIEFAGPDSVTYVADIFTDNPGAEEISFSLSSGGDPDTPNPYDTILMKVVRDTSGVVLWSAPQAYGISSGGLSFRWFNGAGAELENPVPHPEQVGEIFVSVTSQASRELRSEYPTLTLTSTVYPRNLPLTPARSRPSAPGCSPLTFPDCESATMTWTTPTTNTDGTPLPLSDISHFNFYFGTDPNDMSLYTKLARTINTWTINSLEGGAVYYFAVTCVSRAGVESYRCGQSADMTSPLIPVAPSTLTVIPGAGCTLQWSAVTQFTSGDAITTPVSYVIYRDVSPGFTPDAGNRLDKVSYTTTYMDTTMVACSANYYVVQAEACGNEGDPSPEVSKDFPAPPAAVAGLTATPGQIPESVVLHWSPFTMRNDGTALDPADITAYKVYADVVSAHSTLLAQFTAPVDSIVISGLTPCQTWYMNLSCVDACGHEGDYIPSATVPVLIAAACQPGSPSAPPALVMTPTEDSFNLEWPANSSDCDLWGYRVDYGPVSGGPYDGVNAAEGPSPILLSSAAVVQGSVCRFTLSGLEPCTQMFAVVHAVDNCTPANTGPASPEDGEVTTCIACETAATCGTWTTTGTINTEANTEVYTTHVGGETLLKLTPAFSGPALVSQVWYGRPLVKIWASDGSAGEDGAVGPRPSGSVLNIADINVPSSTTQWRGAPLRLVLDQDMRGVNLNLTFRGNSGTCSSASTVTGGAVFDDWNDGNTTGWTPSGGSWTVSSGELAQTLTSSSYVLFHNTFTAADQTVEANVKVLSGNDRSAYIAFRGQNNSNYYLFGIRTNQDRVKVVKVTGGSLSGDLAYASRVLNDNEWYGLRVTVTGNRIRGWLNCEQVIDYTDAAMWASGKAGLSTRRTSARLEDVRIYNGTVLP